MQSIMRILKVHLEAVFQEEDDISIVSNLDVVEVKVEGFLFVRFIDLVLYLCIV